MNYKPSQAFNCHVHVYPLNKCYNTYVHLFSFVQTAFTIVFFCALHEFVRIKFNKHTHIQDDTADGEMPLIPLHAKGTSIMLGIRLVIPQFESSNVIIFVHSICEVAVLQKTDYFCSR